MFQYMSGVAGFAAAMDYFYFTGIAEYFMVAGYNFEFATTVYPLCLYICRHRWLRRCRGFFLFRDGWLHLLCG
jgi:hypothetical protein